MILVGGIVAFASLLNRYEASQVSSQSQVRKSLEVVNAIRMIDAVEWRPGSEENEGIIESFEIIADGLIADLDSFDSSVSTSELRVGVVEYTSAVRDKLVALQDGDIEGSDEIDETRVDPGFDSVFTMASEITIEEWASADRSRKSAETVVWVTLVGMATFLGALMFLVQKLRERGRRQQVQSETDERFRSFVEGSMDTITIVSDDDDLTILSPHLGSLAPFATTSTPSRMLDLFQGLAYSTWKSVDRQLRTGSDHQNLDVECVAEDGASVYFEGHGSRLPSDPKKRVWVWRDITQRRELELQLNHQAMYDDMTGLANRSLFNDRADHALALADREHRPVTVLFCDIDDFKNVNDSLGHGRGDEMLQIVAERLTSCVRDVDTVARLGGDEFAILFESSDVEMVEETSQRILEVVAQTIELGDRTVVPSLSIGIATATVGTSTEELLRAADLAMYAAKRSGKGRWNTYQRSVHETSGDLLELQSDLRTALTDGQFSLHYQPTINLADGSVEGVEALIRWHHPTRGDIRPDTLIPVAESTGIIIGIGRWVLEEACRAGVELQNDLGRALLMAVNLSPVQLRDPAIVRTVEQALEASGMQPDRLVLEFTEGSLLDDAIAIDRLHELRALGVLIAIDDFGTGCSSINSLHNLPISIVKIDRSFISGDVLAPSERREFLGAIVNLAHSLGLRTVGEGIEQDDQLNELKELGCDTGQGFIWSPGTPLVVTQQTIERITVNNAAPPLVDRVAETSRR